MLRQLQPPRAVPGVCGRGGAGGKGGGASVGTGVYIEELASGTAYPAVWLSCSCQHFKRTRWVIWDRLIKGREGIEGGRGGRGGINC